MKKAFCLFLLFFVCRSARLLYAAKTGIKEIWHVEGATHADSYLKYAKEYTEIVKSFVERYNIPKDMNNLPSQ